MNNYIEKKKKEKGGEKNILQRGEKFASFFLHR